MTKPKGNNLFLGDHQKPFFLYENNCHEQKHNGSKIQVKCAT